MTKDEILKSSLVDEQVILKHLAAVVSFLSSLGFAEHEVITIMLQLLLVKLFDEQKRGTEVLLFQDAMFGNEDEFFSSLQTCYQLVFKQLFGEQRKNVVRTKMPHAILPPFLADLPTKSFFAVWKENIHPFVLSSYFDYQRASNLLMMLFDPFLKFVLSERKVQLKPLIPFLLSLQKAKTAQDESMIDLSCGDGTLLIALLKQLMGQEQHLLFNDYSLFYNLTGVEQNRTLAQLCFVRLLLSGYKQPQIVVGDIRHNPAWRENFYSTVVATSAESENETVQSAEDAMVKKPWP